MLPSAYEAWLTVFQVDADEVAAVQTYSPGLVLPVLMKSCPTVAVADVGRLSPEPAKYEPTVLLTSCEVAISDQSAELSLPTLM